MTEFIESVVKKESQWHTFENRIVPMNMAKATTVCGSILSAFVEPTWQTPGQTLPTCAWLSTIAKPPKWRLPVLRQFQQQMLGLDY